MEEGGGGEERGEREKKRKKKKKQWQEKVEDARRWLVLNFDTSLARTPSTMSPCILSAPDPPLPLTIPMIRLGPASPCSIQGSVLEIE